MHGEETPVDGELVAASEEFRAVKDYFDETRDATETADRGRNDLIKTAHADSFNNQHNI